MRGADGSQPVMPGVRPQSRKGIAAGRGVRVRNGNGYGFCPVEGYAAVGTLVRVSTGAGYGFFSGEKPDGKEYPTVDVGTGDGVSESA